MSEYAWICLNLHEWFLFYISLCYPLSTWTRDYIFHRLQKTRGCGLKENGAAFLTTQNFIFSLVAGSIWFNFCFRLNCFTSKYHIKFAIPLRAEGMQAFNLEMPAIKSRTTTKY